VFGVLLPERDTRDESMTLARDLCGQYGVDFAEHDIAPALDAVGCYAARDEAVRSVYADFRPEMPWKIAMHGDRLNSAALNFFHLVVDAGGDEPLRFRLPPKAYLQIVAATNFKQRTRKMLEYFHADRLVFAVAGTPNRLEYDQGFFVKTGDGAADVKPIASLYKTQVYALAAHLDVPAAIVERPPTTETYSLEQSQEEFYFSVGFAELDLILWAKNHDVESAEVASVLELTEQQVERVYEDIDQKRRTTAYLHAAPLLLEPVDELKAFALT
jgi:NAD+ synthase